MKITKELVDYIALLSRLQPDESERVQMTAELEQIVSYMDILSHLDTGNVEPLSHVVPLRNVMREDIVEPSFPKEELLKNAPGGDDEAFLVPKAVE
ncbi:MAG: Asp-tRNA(Asn)/Glu-tRNA(Gln) amidotransferase subunit GatC [Oscillospiraceae bacterium]|nr:Asp-tRNA(Asn)/Glu-tRNA(Gln) amidotransferase subunit GatC [Oscillospiraceae bacterium]